MSEDNQTYYKEPSLPDLMALLWRRRGRLVSGLFLGLVVCFMFITVVQPFYRAEMIVGPPYRMEHRDTASALALKTLSQNAPVMGGENLENHFVQFEQILRGPGVAKILLRDEKIQNGLLKDKVFGFLADHNRDRLEPDTLSNYLKQRVAVDPVLDTPLRRVSYTHPNPEFAAYLLKRLHATADALIKARIQSMVEDRIKTLKEVLNETRNPEYRKALTALLMIQEQQRITLAIEHAFAASLVEPPYALSNAVWPNAGLSYILFMLIGAVLALLTGSNNNEQTKPKPGHAPAGRPAAAGRDKNPDSDPGPTPKEPDTGERERQKLSAHVLDKSGRIADSSQRGRK